MEDTGTINEMRLRINDLDARVKMSIKELNAIIQDLRVIEKLIKQLNITT